MKNGNFFRTKVLAPGCGFAAAVPKIGQACNRIDNGLKI